MFDIKPRRNEPIVDENGVPTHRFASYLEEVPTIADEVENILTPSGTAETKINEILDALRASGVIK